MVRRNGYFASDQREIINLIKKDDYLVLNKSYKNKFGFILQNFNEYQKLIINSGEYFVYKKK